MLPLMEVVLNFELWITLCIVGFLAGLIDAIAGGGGMLTVPTLLTAGLPPHVALGTNKLAASFGSLTASITFYKKKLFDISFWRTSIIFTAIGAIAGTLIVKYLSMHRFQMLLSLLGLLLQQLHLFSR